MQVQSVTDVRIYPYYAGITVDVVPSITGGVGQYRSGQMMSSQFHQLELKDGNIDEPLKPGAAYSWAGCLDTGRQISSHWVYCISTQPTHTFGVIYNWARPGCVAPSYISDDEDFVFLEPLTDIVALLKSPNPAYGLSQAHLGKSGWLAMTVATLPRCMCILVNEPSLPIMIAEGTQGLTIIAKSTRTMQSISLDSLFCAQISDTAIFMDQGAI